MIDLGKYISQNTIDGHIHLFNKDGCIPFPNHICVGFCDIEPKYIDSYKSTMNYYSDFIKNYYNENNMILLATSTDEYEMIEIHKKWPNIIKGFGEIKCYDTWKGEELKLNRLSKYWKLFKYAGENNLPIYIHFSLSSQEAVNKFTSILKRFPKTKFVLCHCGMDKSTDNDFCYYSVMKLMNDYKNLWVECSWIALRYFNDNPLKLINMNRDRIILGSDMNHLTMSDENYKNEWDMIHNLDSMIKSDKNIRNLFKF